MAWDVEVTDEFRTWFTGLTEGAQDDVTMVVDLLAEHGPALLGRYTKAIEQSKHGHMRELRIQHKGDPYRVLYAFDPRRTAILLLGGDKTSEGNRWYEINVPKADARYEAYLAELKKEGLL